MAKDEGSKVCTRRKTHKTLTENIRGLIRGVNHVREQKCTLRIQFIFMNANTKMAILPKLIKRFNERTIKIPPGLGGGVDGLIFGETRQTDSKTYTKEQRAENSPSILEKHEMNGLALPLMETCYKVAVIQTL